jgi:CubicO group peptidase (beta-lactamase class C family)
MYSRTQSASLLDVLGDLIAKVSGSPFEVYVKQHILDPLGMSESNFLRAETAEHLWTTPHVWQLQPAVSDVYPYNRRHAPSSTLNSSVLEMANWGFANLNRGELNGERVLAEQSYDVLWTPSAQASDEFDVGLSWFLGSYRGTPTVGHGGGDTGYRSQFTLLPEQDIGVVIASNYDKTLMGSIRDGVLDVLSGYQPTIPLQQIGLVFAKECVKEEVEAAKRLYRRHKAEAADKYVFGDRQLNMVGYYFLRENQVAQAIEIFKFNVEPFPDVDNTYDSLGEAYMVNGDRELAIENYRRALELDPTNDNAK